MDSDDSLSELLCYEDPSFLFQNEDVDYEEENVEDKTFLSEKEFVFDDYIAVYDEECVQLFFDKELSFWFNKNASSVLSDSHKHARLEAITLILKTRAILGLHFQTAYVSVMYFDRYISIKPMDTWVTLLVPTMQLLSMTCLFLAAKMEEKKVPSISAFRTKECYFESKDIRRMEVLILNTLDWEMSSITPFEFLYFFTAKLCEESSQLHMFQTASFILAVMREINLMEYRPSVIAAAATLRTMDQNLTRNALESKMNSISDCPVIELEDVFTCYGLMQKLDGTELNIPKSAIAADLNRMQLSTVLKDSWSSAAVGVRSRGFIFIKTDNRRDRPNKKQRS